MQKTKNILMTILLLVSSFGLHAGTYEWNTWNNTTQGAKIVCKGSLALLFAFTAMASGFLARGAGEFWSMNTSSNSFAGEALSLGIKLTGGVTALIALGGVVGCGVSSVYLTRSTYKDCKYAWNSYQLHKQQNNGHQ